MSTWKPATKSDECKLQRVETDDSVRLKPTDRISEQIKINKCSSVEGWEGDVGGGGGGKK